MKARTKKETAWIDRLQRVLDAQPETLCGYCTGVRIHFFHGKDLPSTRSGGVDQSKVIGEASNTNWDAGAW